MDADKLREISERYELPISAIHAPVLLLTTFVWGRDPQVKLEKSGELAAALAAIPYGRTWSYRDIAHRIGRPTATRAVGAANGRNPLPIVVPCHRVIGADGSLTGFSGGLPIKLFLLRLEGSLPAEDRELFPA